MTVSPTGVYASKYEQTEVRALLARHDKMVSLINRNGNLVAIQAEKELLYMIEVTVRNLAIYHGLPDGHYYGMDQNGQFLVARKK